VSKLYSFVKYTELVINFLRNHSSHNAAKSTITTTDTTDKHLYSNTKAIKVMSDDIALEKLSTQQGTTALH